MAISMTDFAVEKIAAMIKRVCWIDIFGSVSVWIMLLDVMFFARPGDIIEKVWNKIIIENKYKNVIMISLGKLFLVCTHVVLIISLFEIFI